MEYWILFKANGKQHKSGLIGVLVLVFMVSVSLGAVLSVWTNSAHYIQEEMQRAGFGTLTAWVSGMEDTPGLEEEISGLPEIEQVESQSVIFANYSANELESDSEGQLILYLPEENRYRFFTEDLHGYQQPPSEIRPGEIYVSPSMVSIMDLSIGDEICFPAARSGRNAVFTLAGYYEDPFMGSSMIGMKGFLICQEDFEAIRQTVQTAGIDALAREGAMLHIFAIEDCGKTVSELNQKINSYTSLAEYTEFVHSANAIEGFMLILQNAFSGLLLAFVIVLLFVVMIVLGHSIRSAIEADYINMGILKTAGFTGRKLRGLQLAQYLSVILAGMVLGLFVSAPLSVLIFYVTLTTTGVQIPASLPVGLCFLSFGTMLLLLALFILWATRKIEQISPVKAIRGDMNSEGNYHKPVPCISGRNLHLSLALRQILTGKRRYIGACAVAMLLVFFASMIGRMDGWLGADGKGMMDAFNPADHDLGIQVFGDLTSEEAEKAVLSFTGITDSYLLAMPNVSVNGVDYTANVISDPERFHILKGRSCEADDEVVLTEFVAADFGVMIGDTLMIRGDSGSDEYIVSGIYSCANDMGDNIGMSREEYLRIGQDNPHIWCHHYFLEDTSQKGAITEMLENAYGGDVHIHENTWPGLFGIISAMQVLMIFLYIMVTAFILIVTAMTGSRILAAEQRDIGIYKALGFTDGQLRTSFALRFGIVAGIGSCIGQGLAACFTDPLVSGVMKLAGISNFSSRVNVANILFPAAFVTVLFAVFAFLLSGKVKKVDLTILISD